MMKVYVCTECQIVYGHPITYCPGCPNRLQPMELTSQQIDEMRKSGHKVEGCPELKFEYFLHGQNLPFVEAKQRCVDELSLKFNLDPRFIQSQIWHTNNEYRFTYSTPDVHMQFNSPVIKVRVKGKSQQQIEKEEAVKLIVGAIRDTQYIMDQPKQEPSLVRALRKKLAEAAIAIQSLIEN